MIRFSQNDWNRNLATIVQWSPYESEEDLLKQVRLLVFTAILSILVFV